MVRQEHQEPLDVEPWERQERLDAARLEGLEPAEW